MARPKKIKKLQRLQDLPEPEEAGDKPRKADGTHWTSFQDRAAQFRALDYTWGEIAEKLDSTESSLNNMAGKHKNFRDLVDWYRTYFFGQKLDQLMRILWPEALGALHDVLEDRDRMGQENGPDHGEVIKAAKAILHTTGFHTLNRTKRELEAQKEVTGSPGQTHEIRTDDDYDRMDKDQIDERIAHLEKLIEEDIEDGDE